MDVDVVLCKIGLRVWYTEELIVYRWRKLD